MAKRRKKQRSELTGEAFDALSDAEKERIFQELEQESPEQRLKRSKPLTAAERARWQTIKRQFKRVQATRGNAIKTISIGLESTFLNRVDAYARHAGLTRTQLIARALKELIGSAA